MDSSRLDRYGVTPFPPGSLLVAFLCLADDDPGDAQTVCLFHAQQVTIEVDLVSLLRYSAQMVEHEAADALEVLAREVGAEGFVGFPYRDASVQAIGVLAQLYDGGPFVVELVPDLPDDLFDDVFEVKRPSKEPHSSMTTAIWRSCFLRSSRISSMRRFSGIVSTSRIRSRAVFPEAVTPSGPTVRRTSLTCTAPIMRSGESPW